MLLMAGDGRVSKIDFFRELKGKGKVNLPKKMAERGVSFRLKPVEETEAMRLGATPGMLVAARMHYLTQEAAAARAKKSAPPDATAGQPPRATRSPVH